MPTALAGRQNRAAPAREAERGCFAVTGEILTPSHRELPHLQQQIRCRWQIGVPVSWPAAAPARQWGSGCSIFVLATTSQLPRKLLIHSLGGNPHPRPSAFSYFYFLFFRLKIKRREIAAIYRFGESILAGSPGAGVERSIPPRGRVSFVLPEGGTARG